MAEPTIPIYEMRLEKTDAIVADYIGELGFIHQSIVNRILIGDWLNGKWHNLRDSRGHFCGQFRLYNSEMAKADSDRANAAQLAKH